MLKSAGIMFVFALLTLLLITWVDQLTHHEITLNQHSKLIAKLKSITDTNADIDWQNIHLDTLPIVLCNTQNLHLGWLIPSRANGYAGKINLLMGIDSHYRITGITVNSHSETPGIGDLIETNKSDWLKTLVGLSINNNQGVQWRLKRRGGHVEGITGATITSSAVLKSVYLALSNFQHTRARHTIDNSLSKPTINEKYCANPGQ
ncbi:MAG: RnfABCDGE type electron transport complex subunit G [Pseudomonadales bacterium]|nr:RnfABCDGE type electron transport complex subunit G [Pseudomonadales bacterium]